MNRFLLLPLLLAALPVEAGHAQVVSPASFDRAEASTYAIAPFGSFSSSGWRYQQVHDDLQGTPRQIRSFAFRRDGARSGAYMAFRAQISVTLSTASTTAATISSTFNANHGANQQTALVNRRTEFPPTLPGHLPALGFDYEIKFDRPYSFDGKGPLCWEAVIQLQENLLVTVYLDAATGSSSNPKLAVLQFGGGCRHTKRSGVAAANGSSSMAWSSKRGTLYLDGSNLAPQAIAIGVLGFSRTHFGPIPLPLVIPGSEGRYSGTCRFYVSPDILVPVPTTATATARVAVPIPADPKMNGFHLWGQYFVPDPESGNALSLITSYAVEYCWVAPWPTVPVSQVSIGNTFATSGTVRKNQSLVTSLR